MSISLEETRYLTSKKNGLFVAIIFNWISFFKDSPLVNWIEIKSLFDTNIGLVLIRIVIFNVGLDISYHYETDLSKEIKTDFERFVDDIKNKSNQTGKNELEVVIDKLKESNMEDK